MFKVNKKIVAGLAAGTAVVAGGGVAFAFWSTTGTGSDPSTSNATPAAVTYHTTFDAATLAPGTTVPVSYSASNSSPTDLSIVAPTYTITSDSTYTKADHSTASCADFLSLDNEPSTAGAGNVVTHKTTSNGTLALGTATLSFANSSTIDQSSCEGQTVTIALGN